MGTVEVRVKEPILVVGAARSGTKLVRDLIGLHPQVRAIPHDINYVWKYGNYALEHDEIPTNALTPEIERFIHRYFHEASQGTVGVRIVEKTVSNGLRIDFVRRVFPDCRVIHVIRDGRDVAESARRMWQAPADVRHVLRKLRGFPSAALPTYGMQYLKTYLRKAVVKEDHVQTWGPRFRGIDEVSSTEPLLVTCGIQWRETVERARRSLATLSRDAWLEVRYEDLVAKGPAELERIFSFCGLRADRATESTAARKIVALNVGKWRHHIDDDELAPLLGAIGETLKSLGYDDG